MRRPAAVVGPLATRMIGRRRDEDDNDRRRRRRRDDDERTDGRTRRRRDTRLSSRSSPVAKHSAPPSSSPASSSAVAASAHATHSAHSVRHTLSSSRLLGSQSENVWPANSLILRVLLFSFVWGASSGKGAFSHGGAGFRSNVLVQGKDCWERAIGGLSNPRIPRRAARDANAPSRRREERRRARRGECSLRRTARLVSSTPPRLDTRRAFARDARRRRTSIP